ncbi:MAG: septum formation initiator family protein [Candidatus Omnitrophica bacterium]|nr:septum formation initiator family protein [Candidatus Omnitrophota bacterium]
MAKGRLVIRLLKGVGLVAILAFLFVPGYIKIQELKERDRKLSDRVDELRKENEKLSGELERLQNDPVYIEYIARKEMGLVREGEVIYKLIPTEEKK